ncbi:DUF423 domain-containing protein [Paramagnetospirillum kuznetsovii]|nr:DUF423 domain-containing protein [Paramagnetospirillum kuznetsovii]
MRPWILLAGINGALAIGLAAYGAHGVDAAAVPLMEKASLFQLIHAAALASLDRWDRPGTVSARAAGMLWVIGVALFSGSLYAKAMMVPLPLPMVTPAGGVSLLLGWVALAASAIGKRSDPTV